MTKAVRFTFRVLVLFAFAGQSLMALKTSAAVGTKDGAVFLSVENTIQMIGAFQDWTPFAAILMPEDRSYLQNKLQKTGASFKTPFGATAKNGRLFVGGKELKINPDRTVVYDGHVIRYDPTKSFQNNYERIAPQLGPKYSVLDFFISQSHARTTSPDSAKNHTIGWLAGVGLIAAAGFIALLGPAGLLIAAKPLVYTGAAISSLTFLHGLLERISKSFPSSRVCQTVTF